MNVFSDLVHREKILSDRRKFFMSDLVRSISEIVGSRKIFTSPYQRQTDGFIEPNDRTLMNNIRAFCVLLTKTVSNMLQWRAFDITHRSIRKQK